MRLLSSKRSPKASGGRKDGAPSPRGGAMDLRTLVTLRPPPIVDARNKLVLLWSAKSGCTFAVKWLFSHMGLLEEALAYHAWVHKYRVEKLYSSDRHEAAIQAFCASPDTFRVVKVVRDPFKRAVSSYVHAATCGYEDDQIATFLGRPVDKMAGFSFREFVQYLGSTNLNTCDIHHRLQTRMLERHYTFGSSSLINLDHSMQALPMLEQYLCLPQTDPNRYRDSHHHTRASTAIDTGFVGDIRFETLCHSKRTMPEYSRFYDAALEREVLNLYAEDFLRYGFSTILAARH
jgi:Sulfotransferase family